MRMKGKTLASIGQKFNLTRERIRQITNKDDINVILSRKEQVKTQIMENTTAIVSKTYPIPLSEGENAAIMFSRLPVKKKDIEAIKKWLEYFSDNLTE